MLPKHLIKDQLNQKRIKALEDWSKILLNFLVPNCVWLKQIFTWGVTETCKGKERTCSNILFVLKKTFMHAFSIKWVSEWSLLKHFVLFLLICMLHFWVWNAGNCFKWLLIFKIFPGGGGMPPDPPSRCSCLRHSHLVPPTLFLFPCYLRY